MQTELLTFDRKRLLALKRAYNRALTDGKTQFTFEGHELVVDYAKYLIEHLENQFARQ